MSEITEKLIIKHRLIFSGDIWKKKVLFLKDYLNESLQNLKFWKVFFTVEFYKFWNGNIFFNTGIFFLYSVDKNSDFDCPITIIIIKIIWSSKSEGETEDWYNYSTLIVLVAFLQWFFLFAFIFPVLILNTSWFL